MSRLEIHAFSDEHLDAAAAELAERHRRHCEAESLLSRDFDFRAEVEALWRTAGASGAAADGGYVLGAPRADAVWGESVWVEIAGHAAADPELVRDLYGVAATEWLERGSKAHYALVPATDATLVDAWFRLGFGGQQALGIREVPETEWPSGVRDADERDVDALVELAPLLSEHQQGSPVFAPSRRWTDEDVRKDIVEDLAREDVGSFVAELDGRIVGNFVVCPVELSSMHVGLARPPGAAYLAFALTRPDARGAGAGVALTEACFAWARARGHDVIVTDWRVTNLLASRFWPRRGFRTTFLRLYRALS